MNYGFTPDLSKTRWIAPWAESGFTKPLISGKESRQFWNMTKGRGNNLIGWGSERPGEARGSHAAVREAARINLPYALWSVPKEEFHSGVWDCVQSDCNH